MYFSLKFNNINLSVLLIFNVLDSLSYDLLESEHNVSLYLINGNSIVEYSLN